MKLKFVEQNDEITTKILIREIEYDFNYIEFIDLLYNGEEIEDITYDGNFTEVSKTKLSEMVNRINDIVDNSLQEIAVCEEN